MNPYILHENPAIAAQWLSDRHLSTQATNAVQTLSSALFLVNEKIFTPLRKLFSLPLITDSVLAKWAAESYANFCWMMDFTYCLLKEYRHRYGREHAFQEEHGTLLECLALFEGKFRIKTRLTSFLPVLPEDSMVYVPKPTKKSANGMFIHTYVDEDGIKGHVDVIASYRRYYMLHKIVLIKTRESKQPNWFALESLPV